MSPASLLYLAIPFLIAALDWVAVAMRWRVVGYITKPGVMVALLLWLVTTAGWHGPLAWFAVGLLFSAGGDILIMLTPARFVAGLFSFFFALACYIVGFNMNGLPEVNLAGIVVILTVVLTSYQVYKRLFAPQSASPPPALKRPLILYLTVLSAMLTSALLTLVRPEWEANAALACSAGALLFYLSDILLAWDRYVTPAPRGRVFRRMLYQTGQMLLILGVAIQLG
jgi:uncharacterized membrane protein YhhN